MIDFLVKRFVKNYENTENEKVRSNYGTLSSLVGIVCNCVLFIVKLTLGMISNSIAITSDAFNNLSDSASCIITFVGYKLAAKPADKDHPFGHGRIEYIVSFIIAVIILLVGVELFKSSINKLLNPEPIYFSWVVVFSLFVSILIKFWMSYFNRTLGKRINNSVMLATSKDSLNDVIATSATMVALIGSLFTDLPLDGAMGIIVSLFVFASGIDIIRSTVDELIGQPVSHEVIEDIKKIVLMNPAILGLHDLIIHNYGPGNYIGSVHVEVNCSQDFMIIHDLIDEIERKIERELNIKMTIHMDPIQIDDLVVQRYRKLIGELIISLDKQLSFHDFRVVVGPTHTNCIFDMQIPFEYHLSENEIKEYIDTELAKEEDQIYTVITFEHGYC